MRHAARDFLATRPNVSGPHKINARPPSFVVSALKKTSNGWNQRLDLCLEERGGVFLAVLLAVDFFVVDLDDVDFADDLGGS